MKKVVTIDFDGVVIEKLPGRVWKTQKKNPKADRMAGCLIWVILDKWWRGMTHLWRKPVAGSREGVERLKNKGYQIVLLTSRYGYMKEISRGWLKKWKMEDLFEEQYFNEKNIGAIDSKVENIKIIKSDVHIDDNRETVEELRSKFPDLRVIWLDKEGDARSWDEIEI
jgi:hypothetical protein